MHEERRAGLLLDEQRQIGDLDRQCKQRLEMPDQRLFDPVEIASEQRPGQRHVEAEFVHHIRMTPAIQVGKLRRRQAIGIAPLDLRLAERGAIAVELLHTAAAR